MPELFSLVKYKRALETNIDEEEEVEKNMKISDDFGDNNNNNNNNKMIIVSVRFGGLGTIKKGSGQDLLLLPGHPSSVDLQITPMSTAHTIRKVLR
jgi:hypothetical protein